MKKDVYFVRHGESIGNADRMFRGPESSLTGAGHQQASTVSRRLRGLGIEVLLTSPYTRAIETAMVIGNLLKIVPEPNAFLAEWKEPSYVRDLEYDHPLLVEMRESLVVKADDPHFRLGDQETFAEVAQRAANALDAIVRHPASCLCVVTHGSFLRVLLGIMIFKESFSKKEFAALMKGLAISNTGITYAVCADEEWKVLTWNDQSHLG